MKRTPRSASKNHYPTCADITAETEQMFANAGQDIPPIELDDPYGEIEYLKKMIDKNSDWDEQVQAMEHLTGLINGNALENEAFRHELPSLYTGLSDAVKNLRSALVKRSCLLISQLAREMGNNFDRFGDFITPLSTQLSHGTQIIAESCKYTILIIVKHCQTRKILSSIIDLSSKKGSPSRNVISESYFIIISTWNLDSFQSFWKTLEKSIIELCSDASPDARSFARDSILQLAEKDPKKASAIILHLDPRTRKKFEHLKLNMGDEEPVYEPVNSTKKPTRAPSPRIPVKKLKISDDLHQNEIIEEVRPKSHSIAQKPKNSDSNVNPKISKNPPKSRLRAPSIQPRHTTKTNITNEKPRSRAPSVTQNEPIRSKPEPKFAPSKPAEKKLSPKFKLQNGQERSFLSGIRNLIDEGEIDDIQSNLTDVSLGVLKCCVHSSPQIQNAAFSILNDLISPFHDHFQPSLRKLLSLILHAIESYGPRSSTIAQKILTTFPKFYDCTELLTLSIKMKATYPILNLICSLVSMNEAPLSDDRLCTQILEYSFPFHKNNDMKIRHTTAHIFIRIDTENHSIVKQFCQSIDENNRESFEDFISPYLPSLTFNHTKIDIPQFDPKNPMAFRRKIEELIENCPDVDWTDIRSIVYNELNNCLQSKGQEKFTLNLIKNVFQDRGTNEFYRLLPGLLLLSKNSPFSSLVNNILVVLIKDVEINIFISAIVSETKNHPEIASYAIDTITRVFATINSKDASKCFSIVLPLLQNGFLDENPELRKSVVMCFVEMKVVDCEKADELIRTLAKAQQKLIAVYYSRRIA